MDDWHHLCSIRTNFGTYYRYLNINYNRYNAPGMCQDIVVYVKIIRNDFIELG